MNSKAYKFRSADLFRQLAEKGVFKSDHAAALFMYAKRQEGKFIPPTRPGKWTWMFNQDQIDEIIEAFSPGGDGEWKFQE